MGQLNQNHQSELKTFTKTENHKTQELLYNLDIKK